MDQHKRGRSAAIGAALLGLGLALVVPAAPANAAAASGQKLGQVTLAGAPGYSLAPGKKVTGKYAAAKRRASGTANAQLAWLANAAGTGTSTQKKAVSAVVRHLAVGGTWKLTGKKGKKQLKAAGPAVTRLAASLLTQSAQASGAWKVRVAPRVKADDSLAGTATVTTARGVPLANQTVTVRAGAGSTRVVTDARGAATWALDITARGPIQVSATVAAPDWLPTIRTPRTSKAAAVLLVGKKRQVQASAGVVIRANQSLSVTAADRMVGESSTGNVRLSGGYGARTVTFELIGPAMARAGISPDSCVGAPIWSTSRAVPQGPLALPAYQASTSGHYKWRVTVTGAYSKPVQTCAVYKVVRQTETIHGTASTVPANTVSVIVVDVAGFDWVGSYQIQSTIYGPFTSKAQAESAGCDGHSAIFTYAKTVSGAGMYTVASRNMPAAQQGQWFVWRSTLLAGDVTTSSTTCGPAFKVTAPF